MLRPLLELNRTDTPPRVALRNTAGVVLPLVLGAATGQLAIGLAVSSGAWMTMFSDQPGPYALRIRRVLATAVGAGLSAFAGYAIGGDLYLAIPAIIVWGFVGGLMVALGPAAGRVGLNGVILFTITAASPKPLSEAAIAAGLIVAGGVLQTLLSVAAWPLQRYRPERHALAQVYRELANAARHRAPASEAPPVSQPLTDVHLMLYGIRRSSNVPLDSLRVVLELTERIRLEVLALIALQEWLADRDTQARIHAALEMAATVLDAIADALWEDATPTAAAAAVSRFDEQVAALDALGDADADTAADPHAVGTIVRARISALGGMLRSAIRNATYAGSQGELRAMSAQELLPASLRGDDTLAILRANLSLSSVAFRHAVRSALCLAIAMAINRWLNPSHGYWIPMTVAIVLKPDFGGTFSFGLLRVAGTLVGLALATGIAHALDGVWERIAALAIFCYGFRVVASVNYGLAVTLLTSFVVIQLSFVGEAPGSVVLVRAVNTSIGALLALLAYLVWPTWERHQVRATLASMLDSYGAYFLALLHGDARTRQAARLAARMARSNVEDSLKRLSAEPRGAQRLFEYTERIYANANRFVRALMELEAALHGLTRVPCGDRIDNFAAKVWLTLRMLADALVRDEAPLPDGARAAQRTFVKELTACGAQREAPASAAALIYASDRMAESLDTLTHVLREARATRPADPAAPIEGTPEAAAAETGQIAAASSSASSASSAPSAPSSTGS
jgi:uncharacterized membrane protein YccC